ncbi:NAD(P)/FAD-dependent oxidoreductase [Pseudomonas chlororaphis]|uniref:NAD(P)/FAD-dependent oxidoreductase n=1 Tax=Pseudomonas chlororaphis TaxID=587753 RepID=UPI00087D3D8B|nr:NAD(P)/FAD-dependent oxidoreductase [Pseudomonas chlororaphis]AZC31805.1 Thioredoxin reductase [Pseudomonas chlororaphis subsp. piscium]MBP5072413.1 NAD(P)/FAD-dependent oxidoreductase [Pseudomonas chlororaphis]QTT88403.1 NAD(P)/FAD-dependent oxidoreductase [Pseudomonas chlororaphis]WDG77656.1 NAD(P)/FAD-dependent oxidoreductase [Pseudomonas chlororaphis]WDG83107.1 NAD(P)/FAD-dependent oxidoreductase [Pseudomonas chlororaphis]
MSTELSLVDFDFIVIGGSYAGQSAAMQLARARRRVLVMDAGVRRNRFSRTLHGLPGQEGRSPDVIAQEGRAQIIAYPNVQWLEEEATNAERTESGFVVRGQSGQRFFAPNVVLATGVEDDLPPVDGLAQRWGRSVFHCPYCHGYELNQGYIGVLAVDEVAYQYALMLLDWGTVILLTDGRFEPDEAQREALAEHGVLIESQRVLRIVDTATVELGDGRKIVLDGLFCASHIRMASPLAVQLGCAFEEGPMGPYICTSETMETSVPGVFACGDMVRLGGTVPLAVGSGAQAGLAAHRASAQR